MATGSSLVRACTAPLLPFERTGEQPLLRRAGFASLLLIGMAAMEVLSFAVGGLAPIVTSYLWIALSVFCFGYLCREYLLALLQDARKGSFWGLLPLAAAIPLCFFEIGSYAALNTEALSELQHALEEFQKADLGYTSVFWVSYSTRSLLVNLIPSLFLGLSPAAYRIGFSLPIFFGALFFFAGFRRYHAESRFSSAVAGLMTTVMFAYPTFCRIARTFEMAVSSLSFGLWAIGAIMLFASRPSATGALVAAWSIGLLAASFTSGMALVALLLLLLTGWTVRAWLRGEQQVSRLVLAVLINCIVVVVCLRLQTTNTIKPRLIPFSEMVANFQEALDMTLSLSKEVFSPKALVLPTLIAALFALSLRGGLLPAALILWCLPVVWSAINMRGKISPGLPFALYRALIIIPALVLVMGRFLLWLGERLPRWTILLRICLLLLAIGVGYMVRDTYRTVQSVLTPTRIPMGREVVAERVIRLVSDAGYTPSTHGWVVDHINDPKVESFLSCLQYFLPNWQRLQAKDPLPLATEPRQPGIIVVSAGDPFANQEFPGYTKEVLAETATLDLNFKRDFVYIVLKPS